MTCLNMGLSSPVGQLRLTSRDGWLVRLEWGACKADDRCEVLDRAAAQLRAYFAGDLTEFDLPLAPRATPFQHCWNEALFSIRFGETRTYGQLARALEATPQAVGRACAANPIPIIIPCHRVLGSDGLGGYSGGAGIETKIWLLRHESAAGLLL